MAGCNGVRPNGPHEVLPEKMAANTSEEKNLEPTNVDADFTFSDIKVSPKTFKPAAGEMVTISAKIPGPAKVLTQIFDTDNALIREIMVNHNSEGVSCEIVWDGRDMDGRIVPDEAYFFTLEAFSYSGEIATYDPSTFSGGRNIDIQLHYDKGNGDRQGEGAVQYQLPEDARIIVRAGISSGPMLKNIVNWKPRSAGSNRESWDGKDASGVFLAAAQKGFKLMAEGVTLPENSIFTTGNSETNYFQYKKTLTQERPAKKERPRTAGNKKQALLQQFVTPVYKGVDIDFHMEVPSTAKMDGSGLPVVKGVVPVKIFIDDTIKRFVTEQRYEILTYVDSVFVMEQEEGYSPCSWVWDSHSVTNGEYILTVNIATLTGNMASASMKIVVQN